MKRGGTLQMGALIDSCFRFSVAGVGLSEAKETQMVSLVTRPNNDTLDGRVLL